MDPAFAKCVKVGKEKYPNMLLKRMEYGTAGFRDKAPLLLHVMYRMGLLGILRSKSLKGAAVGVMITASHNPEEDNGVKLIDPSGEMLDPRWELYATELVNATNGQFIGLLQQMYTKVGLEHNFAGCILVGKDTRSSSQSLSEALIEGAKSIGGLVEDFGLLTTPQLHYIVCCRNSEGKYGRGTLEGYNSKLSTAFLRLANYQVIQNNIKYLPHVSVDGANGIGALKLKELIPYLKDALKIDIFNDGQSGKLNHQCGADFVKVNQVPPEGTEFIPGHRYASLDGDADRLIYFYLDDRKTFCMLDGDKIATLIALYIQKLVEPTQLDVTVRVIQTAYANSSSTNFITNVLKIPVVCVPTGVKHLHEEAKRYDIGMYFEANGHGTVVFDENAKNRIREIMDGPNSNEKQKKCAQKLLNVIDLINETIGDAISDLLLVETILRDQSWSISDWNALYTDLPNRQLKAKVPDRKMITTTDAERICVKPEGLQNAIDVLVARFNNARAFVRPSGTEDIVRIYAEADTQDNADLLAQEISIKVKEFTGVL